MAWTLPTTRATGDLITPAIWNADVVEDLKYLKGLGGAIKLEDALGLSPQALSASASATRSLVHVNSSGGAVTVTLPTSMVAGYTWVFVKDVGGAAGTNAITIDTQGAETIDGENTAQVNTNYGAMMLVSDGTNWRVLASYGGA